jgi:hypothetical protein
MRDSSALLRAWSVVLGSLVRIRDYARTPQPIPAGRAPAFLYGVAQPILGIRTLLGSPRLLRAALVPALLLALFCAFVAWPLSQRDYTVQPGLVRIFSARPVVLSWLRFIRMFYICFATLAPLPSVFLAGLYARMAVVAHDTLGFGDALPHRESLWQRIRHAYAQALLVAFGPLFIPPLLLVLAGLALAAVVPHITTPLLLLWALHFIIVEALDSARVVRVRETAAERRWIAPRPWFISVFAHLEGRTRWVPRGHTQGRMVRRVEDLTEDWREEIAIVEAQPWMAIGFGLATAALLAIPVLDLLFRPIIIVASVHVMAQQRRVLAAALAAAEPPLAVVRA